LYSEMEAKDFEKNQGGGGNMEEAGEKKGGSQAGDNEPSSMRKKTLSEGAGLLVKKREELEMGKIQIRRGENVRTGLISALGKGDGLKSNRKNRERAVPHESPDE